MKKKYWSNWRKEIVAEVILIYVLLSLGYLIKSMNKGYEGILIIFLVTLTLVLLGNKPKHR